MRVLITGGDGFVGGHLCGKVSKSGQAGDVVGVVRRDCCTQTSGVRKMPNLRWCQADLAEGLSEPGPFDVVIHAAGRIPGPTVKTANLVRDNVIATQSLAEFASQNRVNLFVYLSALSVYGRIDSTVVDEMTPIVNPTPYGMTKRLGEVLLQDKEGAFRAIVIRLPLVVGKGMRTGWLYSTYEALVRGEPVKIYNGESPYNMIHVSDLCDLVTSVLDYDPGANCLFTVGCRDHLSVREIVQVVKRRVGSRSVICEERVADRGFVVSSDKAGRVLGFRPRPAREIVDAFLEEQDL